MASNVKSNPLHPASCCCILKTATSYTASHHRGPIP